MTSIYRKAKQKTGKKLPGRAVTPDEIRALLRVCGKGSAGLRNAAFIAVCAGAGLRCFEALGLMASHIEKTQLGTVIRVIRGKGGKSRLSALMPEFVPIVDRWTERRRCLGINGRSPLFCGITKSLKENTLGGNRGTFGRFISTSLMRSTLSRLARKAKIECRVHVHGLRHGMATAWAAAGIELRAISQQLGHASTAVTDRYLQRLNPSNLMVAASSVQMISKPVLKNSY
jgi:integrase